MAVPSADEIAKRMKEENARRRRRDMATQWLRHRLLQEERHSRINRAKLNEEWTKILREATSKDLTSDLRRLPAIVDDSLRRKSTFIRDLNDQADQAEEQRRQAARVHLEKIESLIESQRPRLERLRSDFEDDVANMESEWSKEKERIEDQKKKVEQDRKDHLFSLSIEFEEKMKEEEQRFDSRRHEILGESIDAKRDLRRRLESRLGVVWLEFRRRTERYESTTREMKSMVETMKRRDENDRTEIRRRGRTIKRLLRAERDVKAEGAAFVETIGAANATIDAEKRRAASLLRRAKAQLAERRRRDGAALRKLVVESHDAGVELQALLHRGEGLLQMAEICRKLETEEEKVTPFGKSVLWKEEEEEEKGVAEAFDEELGKEMREYRDMEGFWRRFNKVKLDTMGLELEKKKLLMEQDVLKETLKEFLEGISVHEDVVGKKKDDLVVVKKLEIMRL